MTAIEAMRELNNLNNKNDPGWLEQSFQLMQWASQSPLDWQENGVCQTFLFGRNKEGQLADAASETLDLYGQLPNAGGETFHEAQQIVCGKNATFVIKSNGDVYSCGEGSNGRLGHGHSDDIGSLQIIAGTYLCDAINCIKL